jgi:hypothetical protein
MPSYASKIVFAIAKSIWSSTSSKITKTKSNLLKIAGVTLIFYLKLLMVSYLQFKGFMAAKTGVLAFKVACTPAFDREMLCCSITSCKAD